MKTKTVSRKVVIDPSDFDPVNRVKVGGASFLAPNVLGKRYLSDEERARRKALLAKKVAERAARAEDLLSKWVRNARLANNKVKKLKKRVAYYRKALGTARG